MSEPDAIAPAWESLRTEASTHSRASEVSSDDRVRTLDEALSICLARVESEVLPRDRALLGFECGACEAAWVTAFRFDHSPYRGELGGPLYRDLDEAAAVTRGLLARCHPAVDEAAWDAARRCACGGPAHLVRTTQSVLLRHLVGSGQTLAVACRHDHPDPECSRIPARGPMVRMPDPHALTTIFARPLTLFESWAELTLPNGRLEVEPGVTLWAAPDQTSLNERVAEATRDAPLIAVAITTETAHSDAWPALEALRAHIDAGGGAALTVERAALLAALRRQARVTSAEIEERNVGRIVLRIDEVPAAVVPPMIARDMARFGHALADGCAVALERALDQMQGVIDFMGAVTTMRPDIRFAVENDHATPVRPDGSRGQAFFVEQLPGRPDDPAFPRDVAFLCDRLPAWADITRTCPCGAPAFVQRRIVPAAIARSRAPSDQPWILRTWSQDDVERAVEVVALACDRHLRVESRAVLESAGLDPIGLQSRLDIDATEATFRVRTEIVEDERGARAILVRGHYAASVTTNPRWLSGLNHALGVPLQSANAEAWAFGPGGFCLLETCFDEAQRDLLARHTRTVGGVAAGGPTWFALRVEVDLDLEPAGRFLFEHLDSNAL